MKKAFIIIYSLINYFFFLSDLSYSQKSYSTTELNFKSKNSYLGLQKKLPKPKDFIKQPTLILETGVTNFTISSNIDKSPFFNKLNNLTFKIGNTKIFTNENSDNNLIYPKISQSFLYLENYSSKWWFKSNDNLNTSLWQFGLQISKGSGYQIEKDHFLFLHTTNSFNWSRLNFNELPINIDTHQINPFKSQFRFGNSYISNASLIFSKAIGINFSYERSIIFPGHKFWYWLGSIIIEAFSNELLDTFTKEILERGSLAAPVVDFVLKSSLSYGFYELRKYKMNWPFNTAPPLFNEGFRVGLTILL